MSVVAADAMPFRRKNIRKRFAKKRVPKKLKRYVRSVIEHKKNWKVNDFYYNNQAVTTTGGFANLTGITRSATNVGSYGEEASRVSNRIRIEKISYHYRFVSGETTAVAAADLYNNVRFIIFKASVPYSNVSTTVSSYFMGGTSAFATSPKKPYDRQITFLRDHRKMVYERAAGGGQTDNGVTSALIRGAIRFRKPHYVYFDDDTSSPVKNSVWQLVLSDSSVAPNPFIDGYTRVWYTDA